MKLHHSLLAIAITGLFAAPAFAQSVPDEDDALLLNGTIVVDAIATLGHVEVEGRIKANSRSGAVVEQSQLTHGSGNVATGENLMDATLGAGALQDAQGNMGLNVASGVGNAQSNDAAPSSIVTRGRHGGPEASNEGGGGDGRPHDDDDRIYASAMVFSDQRSDQNRAIMPNSVLSTDWEASLGDDALAGASGNIGVNVAAGVGNAQSNAMAASTNSEGVIALATSDSAQESYWNELETESGTTHSLTASLGSGALAGATGNIGVNVASGVGNLQHNSLSIATASACTSCE